MQVLYNKKKLRARCHSLKPVVIIGQTGITDAVIREIDASLEHHELLKIRVNAADRSERKSFLEQISQKTNSDLIANVGHTACFYRKKSC